MRLLSRCYAAEHHHQNAEYECSQSLLNHLCWTSILVDDRSPRWRYLLRHGLENVGDERTPWTDVVIIPVPVIVHGPVTKFCKGSLSRLLEREFPPETHRGSEHVRCCIKVAGEKLLQIGRAVPGIVSESWVDRH